jgi:APA family basic amino acid/polyamine antiporter
MAAEEPSRIRGGALLGGRGGPLDNFVGDATKYVVSKAACEVILTAPPSSDVAIGATADPEHHPTPAGDGASQAISAAPPLREVRSDDQSSG